MDLSRRLHVPLLPGSGTLHVRPLRLADAEPLADAYTRNARHLAPWEPHRDVSFFSAAGQETVIRSKLSQFDAGSEVPWLILSEEAILGTITLTGIVRGPFLSANLGYWVDGPHTGKGLARAAVAAVLAMAVQELALHRVQAATLVHNTASQSVLKRNGFERIGLAPNYLKIDGTWQDHVLFQRILA
ncbi:GNAT family N-acetyltransferase [Paenarthrobacter sp. NPDC058040]|uniref:GNAT family N-acetyltransferase n=1 Tax=unclassified Paenarthrobacter TaxID=2634190 RepID=UPI0036DEA303